MREKNSRTKTDDRLGRSDALFPVVAIGASSGGLVAFKKLVSAIPENSGMAYILIQHVPPDHESVLPGLLQKAARVPVLEITDDTKVEPDRIYIVPVNKILREKDGLLTLGSRLSASKSHLPIDPFFSWVAEVYQDNAVGIILSGTGSDGTYGLKTIKDQGGITFAQDEKSAEYEDMPVNAVRAGVVDFILPPEAMPAKLMEVTRTMGSREEHEEAFRQILSLLRTGRGTDFTYYKQTTVRRRILRRMALSKYEEPAAYLDHLKENEKELDVLYRDLLIPVTGFFRDPEIFDSLCESGFPKLLENKTENRAIRIWVAGCSTGEEAYSIAICLKEFLGEREEKVRIFATDISEQAIAKARTGHYMKHEVGGASPSRLQEFFAKTNGGYFIKKEIRDMCTFAVHNFLKDPPFSKMDLISCRNVLIYMEPYLQKKVLKTFHYALNPKGLLLLGKSENSNSMPGLFKVVSKHDKLFARKDAPDKFMYMMSQGRGKKNRNADIHTKNENLHTDFRKVAEDILLSKYTPAGVVVNEAMEIVHFIGNTGAYLEQSFGKPTHNLLKLAKAGLAFELRNMLHKVKKDLPEANLEKQSVRSENISVRTNGDIVIVSIEVIPLPDIIDSHYLVLFHDRQSGHLQQAAGDSKKTTEPREEEGNKDLRIKQLERELSQTHVDMNSIAEEYEAVNEELQSANEELLSVNEELQSVNEELETSKEELQSANEELIAVNRELAGLNSQLADAKDYAEAIIATIREPLLVLDKNLHILTANKSFYERFRVDEEGAEGKSIFNVCNEQWDHTGLRKWLQGVLDGVGDFSGFEVSYKFPSIGERIMVLNARKIIGGPETEDLMLLAIEDITARKQVVKVVKESEKRFKNMLMQSPYAFAILKGEDMVVQVANGAMKESLGKGPDLEGKKFFDILPEVKGHGFPELLRSVYTTGVPYSGHESFMRLQRNGTWEDVYFNFVYQPYREVNGAISGIAIIANEVTSEARLHQRIKENEELFHQLANLMPTKIVNVDVDGKLIYCNQNWLDYTGMSFEELKNSGWDEIIVHPDEREEAAKRWKHFMETGGDFELEHRCRDKNGEYRWHLSQVVPVKNEEGKAIRWIGVATEIHKRKVMEQQKENFLKVVSHELKTPVTSIKGYIQLLIRLQDEELGAKAQVVKSYLHRVDSQVVRLTRLISDILDLSRLEENQLDLKKTGFNLNDLVSETVEDLLHVNSRYAITIHQHDAFNLYADKDRIEQVILNLINNAIKYSPHNHKVEVYIREAVHRQVAVSVKDYGIGINKEDQEKIFDRFYRVTGKSENVYSGFGIGLFVSREIIRRHDGSITVESEIGKGSVFTFILPYESKAIHKYLPDYPE